MNPTMRLRSALLMIGAVIALVFAWSAAQGQFRRPPGMPGGGPRIVKVWTCGKCGKEIGRGLNVPPDTCPHCGARIINGVGGGIPQAGMGGGVIPPGMNAPGFNPNPPVSPPGGFNPNPPVVNPPVFNPNPPVNPAPPVFNPNPPVVTTPVSTPPVSISPEPASSPSGDSTSSRNWKLITIVVGVITLGISVLLGGTFLVIYTVKNSGSRAPRRRRRDDYDY